MVLGRVVLSLRARRPAAGRPLAATVYEQVLTLGVAAAARRPSARGPTSAHRGARLGVAAGAPAAGAAAAAPADLRARLGVGAAQGRARAAAAAAPHAAASSALLGWYTLVAAFLLGVGVWLLRALGGRPRGRRPGLRGPGLPALVRRLDAGVHLPLGPRGAGGRVRARAGPERADGRGGGPLGGRAPGADPGRARFIAGSSWWTGTAGDVAAPVPRRGRGPARLGRTPAAALRRRRRRGR